MKHILFLILCIVPMAASAYDVMVDSVYYQPFIQEGKIWEVAQFGLDIWFLDRHVTKPECTVKYWFDKSLSIMENGLEYTPMMASYGVNTYQVGLYREEDGCVYCYKDGKEYLHMDMTLSPGDEFQLQNEHHGKIMQCKVTRVTECNVYGQKRKEIHFDAWPDDSSPEYAEENIWIEGVGNPVTPEDQYNDDEIVGNPIQSVKSVMTDGKIVYAGKFDALYYFGWPMKDESESVPLPWEGKRLKVTAENQTLHIKGHIRSKFTPAMYIYCTISEENVINLWQEDLTPNYNPHGYMENIYVIDLTIPRFCHTGTFTWTDSDGEHFITLQDGEQVKTDFESSSIWQAGTEWEVHHYDDEEGEPDGSAYEAYALTEANGVYLALYRTDCIVGEDSMPDPMLLGYVRNVNDTAIYVRPVNKFGAIGPEQLLYDFSQMYEYGNIVRYGVMESDVREMTIDWHTDSLDYYILHGEGQRCLPAWQGIVYRYGYLGGPMELFYNQAAPSRTKRPKPSNISHVIFTTKGGKGVKVNGTESGRDVYIPYDSMLEPGKMWECLAVRGNDPKENQIYTIEVAGERMIGGRRCTVLRSPEMGVEKTVFEEGRKLYDVRDDSPELLLDFGLESGDRIDEVKSVLDVSTQDDYRIITIDTGAECEPYEWDKTPWLYSWVEGIGASRDGGFLPDYETSYLLRCWRDGNLIYQTKAYDTVGIRNVETDADATLYDLTGRRTDGNTRGVMIRNGKKYVK